MSRNSETKIKKANVGQLSAKVVHAQPVWVHCRKWSATVIPHTDNIMAVEDS